MRSYVPLTGYNTSKEKQKASHQGFEKQFITFQIFINNLHIYTEPFAINRDKLSALSYQQVW